MVEETRVLLGLWKPGMSATSLKVMAVESGEFPGMSARRVRNLVVECFAPRFLAANGRLALFLKSLKVALSPRELEQILFVAACRANAILADFVLEVYWPSYAAGATSLGNEQAQEFVSAACQAGATTRPWSDSTIRHVAARLTGACADFGLLERGRKTVRALQPFRMEPRAAIALAYELHFSGLGDNAVVGHTDWTLFGLERPDVVDMIRRLSLKDVFVVQTAGDAIRIGWRYGDPEELTSGIPES